MSSDWWSTPSPTWALGLEGWSQRSVFGWDEQVGTWWAQLWRDGSVALSPEIWIADAGGQLSELVRLVAGGAGVGFEVADWALAESLQPQPAHTVPLDLAGWEPRSIISWDRAAGWSARLWAGDTTSAYPDFDIRPVGHDRAGLIRAIAARVVLPIDVVAGVVARSARPVGARD
ncbi:MAG TPA: hypothetical protein VGH66_13755 [Acidimicrobiales bacterium]